MIGLLLHGRNPFAPFLIRAAAALMRHHTLEATRLARAAKCERCQRVMAYIAQAGADHDAAGSTWWTSLLVALGPQRPVPAVEMAAIENDGQFWQALDLANRDLEPEGLYMTHLFSDDQVILSPDWLQRIVPLPSPSHRPKPAGWAGRSLRRSGSL